MAQAPQRFRAHLRRFLDLLVAFDEGNPAGDAPVELARGAQARLDDPFSALAALACLHRRGPLDSSWDGLCTAVMGATAREAYQPLVAELLGGS